MFLSFPTAVDHERRDAPISLTHYLIADLVIVSGGSLLVAVPTVGLALLGDMASPKRRDYYWSHWLGAIVLLLAAAGAIYYLTVVVDWRLVFDPF